MCIANKYSCQVMRVIKTNLLRQKQGELFNARHIFKCPARLGKSETVRTSSFNYAARFGNV